MALPTLQLMTRKACCLCEDAEAVLNALADGGYCQVTICDVDAEPMWAARYGMDVPVVLINGDVRLQHRIEKEAVLVLLS